MKEIKLYTRSSYVVRVFFFVKTENNNFIKKTASRLFTDLLSNSSKVRFGFNQALKTQRKGFTS